MTVTATTSMLASAGNELTVSCDWPWPITMPPRPASAPETAYSWSRRSRLGTVNARAACSLSRSACTIRPKPPWRRLLVTHRPTQSITSAKR